MKVNALRWWDKSQRARNIEEAFTVEEHTDYDYFRIMRLISAEIILYTFFPSLKSESLETKMTITLNSFSFRYVAVVIHCSITYEKPYKRTLSYEYFSNIVTPSCLQKYIRQPIDNQIFRFIDCRIHNLETDKRYDTNKIAGKAINDVNVWWNIRWLAYRV